MQDPDGVRVKDDPHVPRLFVKYPWSSVNEVTTRFAVPVFVSVTVGDVYDPG